MTRNYFSKHGGPYFINDGHSHHIPEEYKPDRAAILSIAIAGSILLITIVALVVSF